MHSRNPYVPDKKRVFVRLPPPSSTVKGAVTRFIRRYDGPFLVVGYVHGREALLRLRHITTGKELGAVNIDKIVVVPDGDPLADIRPDTEQEQPVQAASPSFQERTVVLSPHITTSSDLAKVALVFGQLVYLFLPLYIKKKYIIIYNVHRIKGKSGEKDHKKP